MRILGAILAGGQSRRFGSDKAVALLDDGRPMIAHVADRLMAECGGVVVCGRDWGGLPSLPDQPRPGLGPLGGLCAALAFAEQRGDQAVLCAPCDMPELPQGLLQRLAPAPAVAKGQWLLGLWPVTMRPALTALLQESGAVSMQHWIARGGVRVVDLGALRNINRIGDLRQPG